MSGWGRRPYWYKQCQFRQGGLGSIEANLQCVLEFAHDYGRLGEADHVFTKADGWALRGNTGMTCVAPGCGRELLADGMHVWESD